ncbi:DUF2589 domain-containing protein [Treponema sp.]|uniref:DUF2589 domain-containing protein n=1 Tax=Treponema sp. TaxID=166 RepID=UPI003F11A593
MATETGTDMKNSVTGISIADLIAAPLKAAADAQLDLAKSNVDFIRTVGIEKSDDGKEKTRNLSFTLHKTEKDGKKNELSVQAPLLAVVPIPNLAVEEVNIEFQMEVTSATKENASSSAENNTNEEREGITVCGKVSANAASTRKTNQSAKYQIQVKARKQEMPEGLSRMLDILAQSVSGFKKA